MYTCFTALRAPMLSSNRSPDREIERGAAFFLLLNHLATSPRDSRASAKYGAPVCRLILQFYKSVRLA